MALVNGGNKESHTHPLSVEAINIEPFAAAVLVLDTQDFNQFDFADY